MGVYFKLLCKDGTVGERAERICWGFLKEGFKRKVRIGKKLSSPSNYRRERSWSILYQGRDLPPYEEWKKKRGATFTNEWGISLTQMEGGVTGVRVMLGVERRVSQRKNTVFQVFQVMYTTYPKLFECVSKVHRDYIEVDFNHNYAEVYNVLRLISSANLTYDKVLGYAKINPELSPILVNIYPQGEMSTSDSNIFRLKDSSRAVLDAFIRRKAWRYKRTSKRYNLLRRQSCRKHHNIAFLSPVMSSTDGKYRSVNEDTGVWHVDKAFPEKVVPFIEKMGGKLC